MIYRAIKIVLVGILMIFSHQNILGQSSEKIDALNSYVQFLNESVHGLFTAHALMVISNKEVNRYIDLDSYILNNISNDEVQSNLFAKSDKENYTTFHTYSPLDLVDISRNKSKVLDNKLAQRLNKQVDDIVVILNKINRIRIDIADFISSHDLNEKESIYGVFELLEEGVTLFSDYSKAHSRLSAEIEQNKTVSENELLKKAKPIHSFTQTMLRNLRAENDVYVDQNVSGLQSAFREFDEQVTIEGLSGKQEYSNNIKVKLNDILKLMSGFLNPGYVPVEHELYGKHYYYHNELAKRYFNWSGPGFVRNLNKFLDSQNIPFVHFVEEPLIFKVVYPMKLDELNKIDNEKDFVEGTPPGIVSSDKLKFSSIKEREEAQEEPEEVVVNPIVATAPKEYFVTLEFYDFNLFDRDSISVNFNGEWLFENHMLTPEPLKIKVTIDPSSNSNILLFRAENLGIMAPNTFAVGFRFSGQRKKHIKKYNLYQEQVIEIDLNNFH